MGIRVRRTDGGATRRVRRAALAGVALLATTTVAGALPGEVASASPLVDTGTMSAIAQITGTPAMWNLGFTGAGVGVAVIDTGVARVPGLDHPGKVVDGPDLSFDSQVPELAHTDAFGHGTHIAGIIAGSDVAPGTSGAGCTTCSGPSAYTDTTKFVGIAPQARIINVKVGASDGSVDVTQVIAGINWVIQHRNDAGLNIRVLNLSFGTDSVQPAMIDPLVYAAERAWDAGIVVVAAGGNDGAVSGPLANPAMSPSIIAVGSTDPVGTLKTDDDLVGEWAQHGTTTRPVDISVPGKSVQSLSVPGGFVDSNVTTGREGRFQRATGTSQSAAVVSGMVALMLQRLPFLTPDVVKTLLTTSAAPMLVHTSNKKEWSGAGTPNLETLIKTPLLKIIGLVASVVPSPTLATGTGQIEQSRGTYHVAFDEGPELRGEVDIFGRPWDSAQMASTMRRSAAWNGGVFNLSRWTSDSWTSGRWPAVAWTGTDWTGEAWHDATDGTSGDWSGARWSGARWSGARWSGARWSGARWCGARWSGARWSGARWS